MKKLIEMVSNAVDQRLETVKKILKDQMDGKKIVCYGAEMTAQMITKFLKCYSIEITDFYVDREYIDLCVGG